MSTHTLPRRRGLAALLALVAFGASACSAPRIDLAEWPAREVSVRPAEARGEAAADLARVDTLREARDLAGARTLALQLAPERPEDGAAQLMASRAESDGMLRAVADKYTRNHCAAALAIVHLRLETLPWIAKLMARGRPAASLEEAERLARVAVGAVPSREHRLVLAKVLRAADRDADVRAVLDDL